ncbi:MAG: hypothetical protein HY093_04515 [Candidatus Liptonbacteria bacterium]|nr:hypothetical protein [Candidatus Liptonbacteria bacterium]
MASFYRKTRIFFAFGLIILGTLVVTLVRSFGGGVPQQFADARLQGALIAQAIVDLSNQSISDLETINKLDRQGSFSEALKMVGVEIQRSQEIRDQAIKLSAELEKMTRALSDLKSFEARQAALESISNHLALISRLVNYSGYLSRLLDVLRVHFEKSFSNRKEVDVLVKQINDEIIAINSFNDQANQAMKRFDDLVRVK